MLTHQILAFHLIFSKGVKSPEGSFLLLCVYIVYNPIKSLQRMILAFRVSWF